MPGVELIAVERKRQIEYEGWTAKHDDSHQSEELVKAAICYLTHIIDPTFIGKILHKYWPFDTRWWKPKDRKRNLIRAGALIAAELDRLMRLDEAEQS